MAEMNDSKLPVWFWIVSAVALVWNLLGVMAYIMQVTMSDEVLAALPEADQAAYAAEPAWATGAFAVAVFGGALGCLLLLLRKRLAVTVLLVSLLAVIIQQIYMWGISGMASSMSGADFVMPIMIPVIAILLVWFARSSTAKNWLK